VAKSKLNHIYFQSALCVHQLDKLVLTNICLEAVSTTKFNKISTGRWQRQSVKLSDGAGTDSNTNRAGPHAVSGPGRIQVLYMYRATGLYAISCILEMGTGSISETSETFYILTLLSAS
jgi:hypothetical protein